MMKFIAYLSLSLSLLLGFLIVGNTTTVKADSLGKGYDFAVMRTAYTTDLKTDGKGVTLPVGSAWKINSSTQIGEETFLELAPNTYVHLFDGYTYLPISNDVQTLGKKPTPLYNYLGQVVTDRELAPGTDWYIDRVQFVNHQEYFRVATDEFVSYNDVAEY